MTQEHRIAPLPPPELVDKWNNLPLSPQEIIVIAWQHGADQELEACCEWLYDRYDSVRHATGFPGSDMSDWLRTSRRPKPPSLKRVALLQLDVITKDLAMHGLGCDLSQIRRALESIPDPS